ncbi:hypothetical protein LOTGIDRAFT_235512 [Lottia gigantea]|uniref:Shugoshin C-terminal domain-containing protein n=1 Tax=Lottia gigantea TaxID=225164 RepID=V4BAY6_LOTGI|nr:hypothetical protein LOTGIDRAFT_235512 [Lottia gigantea]ESO86139.1 hypothetical protein LOTGIDRAFT_235512 [Lottia gigantea]
MSEMIEEEDMSIDEDNFLSNIRAKMKSKSTHFNTPGRRKKIISTKLCNVSMGSISKESLRGKNRVLALDVQKAKITLGKLNEKYIKLQQENQDNMILLNKKRMEKNDLQKIYETETKKGIEKATEKIDIMLNRYLTELIVNSTTLDMKKRPSTGSRSPIQASKSQPNCVEKTKVDRIDRKIRRSRLSLDQKLAARQPVIPSENTKQFNEKMCNTNSVTNKGRHPSSVVIKAPSFSKPVQHAEETFLAIPIGMMSDLVDENHVDNADDDMEMNQDFNQTIQPLNISVCDLTSESDTMTFTKSSKQTKNKRPQQNNVAKNSIVSKDAKVLQKGGIMSKEKHTFVEEAQKSLEPTKSAEGDSKEKPANKLLLTSRDRTKICNVRDMIIPKPKVKSKLRKKEEIKVPEKTKSSPSRIPVFDFSMQSPTIELPESYKEIPEDIKLPGCDRNSTELITANKPVKSKSRSRVIKDSSDNQTSKSSPVSSQSDSQLLKKIKSLNKGQSKKIEECSDSNYTHPSKSYFQPGQKGVSVQDTSNMYSVSLKSDSPAKQHTDNLKERSGRSKSRKGVQQNTTHGETYTVPMKTGSPEKLAKEPQRRGRSRSRGRTLKNAETTEKTKSQTESPTKGFSEVAMRGPSRSCKRTLKNSDDDLDSNKVDDSLLLYTVPMKTESPEKATADINRRGRSSSRGRTLKQATDTKSKSQPCSSGIYSVPMKLDSPEKSTKDSQRRGRSRSRARTLIEDNKNEEVPLQLNQHEEDNKPTEDEMTHAIDNKDISKKIEDLKNRFGIDKDQNNVSSKTAGKPLTEPENFEEYSVPLKTCSPEEKLVVRRGRSRSRGRPKAQEETLEKSEKSSVSVRSRARNKLPENSNSENKSLNSEEAEMKNCATNQIENQERSRPSMKRGRSQNGNGCEKVEISDSESDEIVRSAAPKRRSRSRTRRRPRKSETSTNSDFLNGGHESNDLDTKPNSAVTGKSHQRENIIFKKVPKIVIENENDLKTKTPMQVSEDSICTVFKNRPSIKSSRKSLVASSPPSSKENVITPDPCPLVKQTLDGRKSSLNNRTSTSKRTVESIGSRDSLDVNNSERKSRRAASSVSYKEPTLNSKLRREDVQKKLLEKEVEKKRLSGQE